MFINNLNGGAIMAQKTEEIKTEITELVNQVIGKLNGFDSKTERADTVSAVLNQVIAGIELSKTEKAGVLAYLLIKRTSN